MSGGTQGEVTLDNHRASCDLPCDPSDILTFTEMSQTQENGVHVGHALIHLNPDVGTSNTDQTVGERSETSRPLMYRRLQVCQVTGCVCSGFRVRVRTHTGVGC